MNTSTRLILSGLLSLVALGAVAPAPAATAATVKPAMVGCCR